MALKRGLSGSATPNPMPATFLRGGTSKGIYLNQADLPSDKSKWDEIFLGIMGSPDPEYGRQLNGMGGGVSSLSKICVVHPASKEQAAEGIDVEYTFVQVGIRDSSIDYSGNCGNLSSMIGVFAVDEKMCRPRIRNTEGNKALGSVRAFNTNTRKVIETTFPLRTNQRTESMVMVPDIDVPETSIAGVPGKASRIILDFLDPSGARTGKLLPSGSPKDMLVIGESSELGAYASLVDATNPAVIVSYEGLAGFLGGLQPLEDYLASRSTSGAQQVSEALEGLRQAGTKRMGLDPSAQAQPKIAIVSRPSSAEDITNEVDVVVHALSMGVLHKAIPMTVGLCLGVAANTPGTLVWDIVKRPNKKKESGIVRLRHPGGLVDVGGKFDADGTVTSAQVVRTGRRLMKGHVWW
ncbi:duf453 domain-containing protein [Moniliophthora roreri MCA 2997]|uniref:Duf453 domain-containing protein n=2 Tax=Moniliophthora roreri TaxID=221103 RepID=V2WW33_MONRO|nr:duf453 domain-containing protein [Moniliophthora roreri MCA 2997]KAI3605498.1 duf453 domain-containing protein [Moniliophthora roreri]